MRLDDLIASISCAEDEPLAQLSEAVLAASHLTGLADHLVGHFVDQARRSGASWTEIGAALGVTKQGAQKKFASSPLPSRGLSRFTDRARLCVVAAMEEARAAGNPEITPDHLLLGLLAEPAGFAGRLLDQQRCTASAVRRAVSLPPASGDVPELVPYDGAAREVLALTEQVALRLGHDYVGTEHLLLALLAHGSPALASLGVTTERTEALLSELLAPA